MDVKQKAVLREALLREYARVNDKQLVSQAQLNAYVDAALNEGPEMTAQEWIKRNPELAFDDPEPPPSDEALITELLRWFHRPEQARGTTVHVPRGHPSGLGGYTISIPKNFPLPDATA